MSVFTAKKASRHRPQDEKERYYLLPGQGGSSYRRKQRFIPAHEERRDKIRSAARKLRRAQAKRGGRDR